MTLEDLKDQLRENWAELRSKIEEDSTFNTLRERYETLSPGAQIGLKLGLLLLVLAIFVYIPYTFFSAASDNVALFEGKRSTIRKLLRASRTASDGASVDNPPPIPQLTENVRSRLQTYALLPEQIGGITPLDTAALGGRYAPKEIEQDGLGVTLTKLNLKQVIEIGYGLQTLMPGVRLVGMEMKASSPDPHYFDVVFKLARFGLPSAPEPPAQGSGRGGRVPVPPPPGEDEE